MIKKIPIQNLTVNEIIEIAKTLCSSRSSFQDDANQILQFMLDQGLTRLESSKLIKTFCNKIHTNNNLLSDNVFDIHNIHGISNIVSIMINYILAVNDVSIINYSTTNEEIQLLNSSINQYLSNDIIEAINILNAHKICFINTNKIHPYSVELNLMNSQALLIKSLITITDAKKAIIYTNADAIMHLAFSALIELEFNDILIINKINQNNIAVKYICSGNRESYSTFNSQDYNLKLVNRKLLSSEESASIIHAICLGYKSDYRDEIIFLSSIILYFIGRAIDLQEGIDIAQSTIESDKIINLMHTMNKLNFLD